MEIKDVVSNVEVYGLDKSILASGYPMKTKIDDFCVPDDSDLRRMNNLGNAPIGSGHDNALNGIIVQFDLTVPIKVWTELQRYHFIDFVSSQSTMHRITKFDFTNSDDLFSEYTDDMIKKRLAMLVTEYNTVKDFMESTDENFKNKIFGKRFNGITDNNSLKEYANNLYLKILYSLPVGFKLTARMTTNYRQLKTIYSQRKNHKLPEWRVVCQWIETLPMFKEFCLKGEEKENA